MNAHCRLRIRRYEVFANRADSREGGHDFDFSCPKDGRRGFTLIDLLVVISIVGLLVGLLLPAVQSAQEAGRRTQCQNNTRNIRLGILGYVDTNQRFPPAGVIRDDPYKMNPAIGSPVIATRNQES